MFDLLADAFGDELSAVKELFESCFDVLIVAKQVEAGQIHFDRLLKLMLLSWNIELSSQKLMRSINRVRLTWNLRYVKGSWILKRLDEGRFLTTPSSRKLQQYWNSIWPLSDWERRGLTKNDEMTIYQVVGFLFDDLNAVEWGLGLVRRHAYWVVRQGNLSPRLVVYIGSVEVVHIVL